jgi:hypothetical protein
VSRERSFHTAILNSNVDLVDRGAFRIRSTSAYPGPVGRRIFIVVVVVVVYCCFLLLFIDQ